jgi:hypothetical protein
VTVLHSQSDTRDDRTKCGVEGIQIALGGRLALLSPGRCAFKLAFEGEQVTCATCVAGVRTLRGVRTMGWKRLLGDV